MTKTLSSEARGSLLSQNKLSINIGSDRPIEEVLVSLGYCRYTMLSGRGLFGNEGGELVSFTPSSEYIWARSRFECIFRLENETPNSGGFMGGNKSLVRIAERLLEAKIGIAYRDFEHGRMEMYYWYVGNRDGCT